jgi:hypothetical protein
MKNVAWRDAEDVKEYKRLEPGGYVCRIVKVEDVPEKEYLKFSYDIALGDFKDHFRELYDHFGNWSGTFIKSYKEKALPFFKGCMTAIERSNPNYIFNDDETTLKGKYIGLVLGEKEYKKQDGGIGKKLYVASIRDTEAIKNGDFEIPEFKQLAPSITFVEASNENDDDDLPF